MLVTLSKIGEVNFYLIGTNGFQVKVENEIFLALDSCCRQNLKFKKLSLEQRLCSELESSVQSIFCAFSSPSDAVALLLSHCSVKEVHLLEGCSIIRQNKILAIFCRRRSVSLALVITATLTEMEFLSLRRHPMHVRWRKVEICAQLKM